MKKITLLSCLIVFSLYIVAQRKPLPAKEIVAAACKQAGEQKKNVLVIFHASWCGWCKKMDASINDPACKKLFDDNYIIAHLTVHESPDKKKEENPGADDILKELNAFDEGIPFWVVYDKEGKILANSFITSAEGRQTSIGCPASKEEVAAFIKILKATASIDDAGLAAITTVFRKNDRP